MTGACGKVGQLLLRDRRLARRTLFDHADERLDRSACSELHTPADVSKLALIQSMHCRRFGVADQDRRERWRLGRTRYGFTISCLPLSRKAVCVDAVDKFHHLQTTRGEVPTRAHFQQQNQPFAGRQSSFRRCDDI